MRSVTLDELVDAPIGRWTVAPPVLLWFATPQLAGITYTGFLGDDALPLLYALRELPMHAALARPYRAIINASAVTGIAPGLFGLLVEHVRALVDRGATLVERAAIVPPTGLFGAASLGLFHQHAAGAIDVRFVHDLDAGLAALDAGDHAAAVRAAHAEASTGNALAKLRAHLRIDPARTLDDSARTLGISARTLQRECLAAGSSYRKEVAAARLELAAALLRTTDDKLEVIARRAGFTSAATLSRSFHQAHGMTPLAYRERHRDA